MDQKESCLCMTTVCVSEMGDYCKVASTCFPTLGSKACTVAAGLYFPGLFAFLSLLISKLDLWLGRIKAKIARISA